MKNKLDEWYRILILLIAVIKTLSLSGCKLKNEIEDFSTGLANRDARINDGIKYIEELKIREAKKFFAELGKKEPNHCGYLIGLPLVQIQEYLAKISSIINLAINIWSGGESSGTAAEIKGSSPREAVKQSYENCDSSIDSVIRDFISSLHQDTLNGLQLVEKAINQKCEMDVEYPIELSVGPNFKLDLVMYGRFGDAELSFLKYLGYSVLIISDAILAHDFSANTVEILSNIRKINTSDIIGLLRSLAFLVEGCSKTFSFHPVDKKFIEEIPDDVLKSIEGGLGFLESIEKRNGKEEYVITFFDRSGEGKLGYDPNRTTIETQKDEITLKIKGEVVVGSVKGTLKALKIKIPYIITTEFVNEFKKVVDKVASIVRERKTGCPDNCISISDANFFLRALSAGEIEDFARFDIMKFLTSPKSLRELLPYWFFNEKEKRWEFMIEGEVPESRGDVKYYLFNYDAPHFTNPLTLYFYGKEITGFSIPPDCVFIQNSPVSWLVIPYLNFQDPTFAGTLYIRLKGTLIERCNPEDYIFESDEWKLSTLYMTGKTIAVIVQKGGSIISPLTELIIKSIELVE